MLEVGAMSNTLTHVDIAIIGGGPAGLMAAEVLCGQGFDAHIFDAMPSLGRKLLMAGKTGLNLTHAQNFEAFLTHYGTAQARLESSIRDFTPTDIRDWAQGLGVETFVGSSGRVFPKDFKSAPLLRAWLHRLREKGASIHVRHKWLGWDGDALQFENQGETKRVEAKATILGLGGASWPKLGSDGMWTRVLGNQGIGVAPLRASNCGFDVDWSDHLKLNFAGEPLKDVKLSFAGQQARGDVTITGTGVESGPVYALSAELRDAIEHKGHAILHIDLLPDKSLEGLTEALSRPRGKKSLATHLKRVANLTGVKSALLHEVLPPEMFENPVRLAGGIKALPISLVAARPLSEAISSAGGVMMDELDDGFMLKALPGVFCAGEMLDWDAPTGGYLLSACFATGRTAGRAAAAWVKPNA